LEKLLGADARRELEVEAHREELEEWAVANWCLVVNDVEAVLDALRSGAAHVEVEHGWSVIVSGDTGDVAHGEVSAAVRQVCVRPRLPGVEPARTPTTAEGLVDLILEREVEIVVEVLIQRAAPLLRKVREAADIAAEEP
jgi:hypothetical protein